jgi:putative DNA topoisomerase
LGCANYPACDYIRAKAPLPQYFIRTAVRTGMTFQHFDYVSVRLTLQECGYTETIDKPDETTLACPQCQQGKLVQRRSRYG